MNFRKKIKIFVLHNFVQILHYDKKSEKLSFLRKKKYMKKNLQQKFVRKILVKHWDYFKITQENLG